MYFDNPNMDVHLKRVAPICTDYMCAQQPLMLTWFNHKYLAMQDCAACISGKIRPWWALQCTLLPAWVPRLLPLFISGLFPLPFLSLQNIPQHWAEYQGGMPWTRASEWQWPASCCLRELEQPCHLFLDLDNRDCNDTFLSKINDVIYVK